MNSITNYAPIVFADHGSPDHFPSRRKTISGGFQGNGAPTGFSKYWDSIAYGIRCYKEVHRHKGDCVFVSVGSGHGFVFAFLQWLLSTLIRPRTHVVFDLLLEHPKKGLSRLLEKFKFHIFNRVIDKAVLWGRADLEIYEKAYQLSRDKLVFHPFHITLERYEFEISDDGYIFAGGNHGRDYETLIKALSKIDFPVFIATQKAGVKELAAPYSHITVEAVSPTEFRQKMAACTICVEAHPKDFFRTAGHQTFLNAMWMGKPFVMADMKSADGYFENGKEWLVVPAGDAEALRNQIEILLKDNEYRRRMGHEAQTVVRQSQYKTLVCMQDIYNIALEIECIKKGEPAEPALLKIYD